MTASAFKHRTSRHWWGFLLGLLPLIALMGGPVRSVHLAASRTAAIPPLAWSTISPPAAPPPLAYASAVYDSDNKTIVLFGGASQDGSLSNDTWVWNGSTWTDYPASATQAPPPRQLASMAFDPGLHQLILFGGQGPNGQLLGDTWAWNGASWYQQSSPTGSPSPGPRAAAAMAYAGSDHLLLFGGMGLTATGASAPLGDTWLWTSDGWTAVSNPEPAAPTARAGAAIAFDPARGQATLFGGLAVLRARPRLLNDLWAWTGQAWSRQTARTSPPARQQATMVDDDLTKGVVVFGGSGAAGELGDTWLWNGTSWSMVSTGRAAALARAGGAAAFDNATHQLIVFGGRAADGEVLGDTLAFGQAPLDLGTTASTSPPTTGASSSSASSSASHGANIQPPAGGNTPSSSLGGATGGTPGTTSALGPVGRVLHRGDLVTLRGTGFRPDTRITITFESASTVVGQATADASGRFQATVAVPETARGGAHRFAATGLGPDGAERQQLTGVTVVGVPGAAPTWPQRAVLTGAALLIPVATWFALSGWGRWRRRHAFTP
jgi:hypothetical protein